MNRPTCSKEAACWRAESARLESSWPRSPACCSAASSSAAVTRPRPGRRLRRRRPAARPGAAAPGGSGQPAMRLRIAAARARVRTVSRIIIGVTVLLTAACWRGAGRSWPPTAARPGSSSCWRSAAAFAAAFWWLHKIAGFGENPRILTGLGGLPGTAPHEAGQCRGAAAGRLRRPRPDRYRRRPGAAPGQPGRGAGGHHPRAAPAAGDRRGGRLGRPAVTLLAGLGLPTRGLRRDLALLGRPPERQLAEQATAAITGMLLAPVLAGLLAADGGMMSLAARPHPRGGAPGAGSNRPGPARGRRDPAIPGCAGRPGPGAVTAVPGQPRSSSPSRCSCC
jgi:hypothetical protein